MLLKVSLLVYRMHPPYIAAVSLFSVYVIVLYNFYLIIGCLGYMYPAKFLQCPPLVSLLWQNLHGKRLWKNIYKNLEICITEDRRCCGWCKELKLSEAETSHGLSPTPATFIKLLYLRFCKAMFCYDTNWYEAANSKREIC